MKVLDISTEIVDYTGRVVVDDLGKKLTVRRLLRVCAGSFLPAQSTVAEEQSIIADAVAMKIHSSNGEVKLTDEEFDVLKLAMQMPRHGAMVHRHLRDAVNNAHEEVPEE